MSKLNPNVSRKRPSKTVDGMIAGGYGAVAKQSNEALLRRAVMSCLLFENTFYQSGNEVAKNISDLIPKVTPSVVANIAIEARLKQKLRHVPLFIATEMCKHKTHKGFVSSVLPQIITRADQITDALALYWKEKKIPLAKQFQKGLAESFHKFGEYAFAKYDRDAKIKLRDVLFLTHPKPRDEKETILFNKIANRTLATPDTWEVAYSSAKNNTEKKEIWNRLIKENKLGALAFLRNLRNMKEVGVERDIIKLAFSQVNGEMLLPLNFMAAVKYAPEYEPEIESLMFRTYDTLKPLPGKTIFVVDVSGSIDGGQLSGKSEFNFLDGAKAMASLASMYFDDIDIYCTAGSDGTRIHKTEKIVNPQRGFALSKQIDKMYNSLGGGGIFTRQCMDYLATKERQVERIIVFSDSQDIDASNGDKRLPKPFGTYNYIVDISSNKHGVNYDGVWTSEITGFSEHFLNYIATLEGYDNDFENE